MSHQTYHYLPEGDPVLSFLAQNGIVHFTLEADDTALEVELGSYYDQCDATRLTKAQAQRLIYELTALVGKMP